MSGDQKKFRENYLGHCLFTANKRAFNNSNPNALWYLKDEDRLAKERRFTAEVLAREGVYPSTQPFLLQSSFLVVVLTLSQSN